MPSPTASGRQFAVVVAVAMAIGSAPSAARADDPAVAPSADPGVQATLVCERAAAPGRVRCEVEVRAQSGTLAWGDVVVTAVAPSLTPLRARIGAPEATMSTSSLWRFTFAVAAKQRGTAKVEARVRLVRCDGARCEPRIIPVQADVVIAP